MKIHTLRMRDGEIIHLHEFEPGNFACPVCGCAWGNTPPYDEGCNQEDLDKAKASGTKPNLFATGSLDICNDCDNQIGYDDYEDDVTTEDQWKVLRQRWLAKVTDMERARKQLRNIGIELPAP